MAKHYGIPSDWSNSHHVPKTNTHCLTLQQGAQKPTFFHESINQSEVEDSFQLACDWIKPARRKVNKLKMVTRLGSLL